MIQAVSVVPRFAPIITPIDSTRVNSPALTKLTTMTVVAEEDWSKQVVRNPVPTPATRLWVIVAITWRILSPAVFWIPSLRVFMPKRNIPRLPRMIKKVIDLFELF